MGGFLAALRHDAPADAPTNPYRGIPLADRTDRLGDFDRLDPRLRRVWSDALAAPVWNGPGYPAVARRTLAAVVEDELS